MHLRRYIGTAWYEKDFQIPDDIKGQRIAIQFMGVDWGTKIYINGKQAGEHEGNVIPFTVDITDFVIYGGTNTITMKIWDFTDMSLVPYDSESAFLRMSGIWRSVWVEATGKTYMHDIFVQPDIDKQSAKVQCEVAVPFTQDSHARNATMTLKLKIAIFGPDGTQVSTREEPFGWPADGPTTTVVTVDLPVPNPQLWDVEHPQLYKLEATIVQGNEDEDKSSVEFGMRKISTSGTNIMLNNKPIYLSGALDFVDYPDRNIYLNPYHPWTEDEMRAEIKRWKDMGFNYIRKFGVEDERYIRLCNKMGVLIMDEAQYFSGFNPEIMRRWENMHRALVLRDRNHPSVILWDLFNEGGGFGGDEKLLKKYYDMTKELDPTRPVIDNSGGIIHIQSNNVPNNHPISDIEDIHYYYYMGPEWYPHSREYLGSIEARDKPVIITEMLALTFPPDLDRWKARFDGKIPWWFNLPSLPGEPPGPLSSNTYEKTWNDWGLQRVFGSFAKFAEENEWRCFYIGKYEIEMMRRNPNLVGFTYTQMDQQPGQGPVGIMGDYGFSDERVFQIYMPMVNNPNIIFFDWKRINYWTTEYFDSDVVLSHYGEPVENAVLKYSLEGTDIKGEIPGVTMIEPGVKNIGKIRFLVPDLKESRKLKLEIELVQGGESVAKNFMNVSIFPLPWMVAPAGTNASQYNPYMTTVGDPLITMGSRLGRMGIGSAPLDPNQAPVALATVFDDNLKNYVTNGGTALLCVQDPTATGKATGLLIGENVYYVGNGGWPVFVDPNYGLFKRIPFGTLLDWQFYRVYSRNTIGGLKPENKPDILSAGYGGWFFDTQIVMGPQNVKGQLGGMITQFKLGKGRIVITTFKLLQAIPDDPVATLMLQDLLAYCKTDFKPTMELPLDKATATGAVTSTSGPGEAKAPAQQ